MFDFDDEFGLDDLIEADIKYGLFEEDEKKLHQTKKKAEKNKKQKSFLDIFKFN